MALVITFIPDPAKAVAEMARLVRPGGLVATYMWDTLGRVVPFALIEVALKSLGKDCAWPNSQLQVTTLCRRCGGSSAAGR
jgi:ubiquinone/menaquinone biosynthesis C-methylase UbiE